MNLDANHAFGLLTKGTSETTMLLLRSIELPWPLVEGFLKLKEQKMEELPDEPVNEADYELNRRCRRSARRSLYEGAAGCAGASRRLIGHVGRKRL